MKTKLISLLVAGTVGLATVGLLAEGYEERQETHEREGYGERDQGRGGDAAYDNREYGDGSGLTYLSDPQYGLYKGECGDCHMAYPPSMLPAVSWHAMMGNLEDHFGDDAELDAALANQITAFLARNAAGMGAGEYSERSRRATEGREPPLRITQTDYFRGQHHEIQDKLVTGNSDVGSFSRCEACHRNAARGDFDEHEVRIPGYGHWDD